MAKAWIAQITLPRMASGATMITADRCNVLNLGLKEYCQEKQPVQKGKPSVREKLNESAPKVTSPKISAKLKEAER